MWKKIQEISWFLINECFQEKGREGDEVREKREKEPYMDVPKGISCYKAIMGITIVCMLQACSTCI